MGVISSVTPACGKHKWYFTTFINSSEVTWKCLWFLLVAIPQVQLALSLKRCLLMPSVWWGLWVPHEGFLIRGLVKGYLEGAQEIGGTLAGGSGSLHEGGKRRCCEGWHRGAALLTGSHSRPPMLAGRPAACSKWMTRAAACSCGCCCT